MDGKKGLAIIGLLSVFAIGGFELAKETKNEKEKIVTFNKPSSVKLTEKKDSFLTGFVKNEYLLDVPHISQLPELMRGCEVTSLAMLLNYYNIEVDKLELAENIQYEAFEVNGIRGNMHEGFVGNMETFSKPGLGVYIEPIMELATQYVSADRIIDLTNKEPENLYEEVQNDRPVWIITNAQFDELSDQQFMTWQTELGEMQVTYQHHSVVVTGYDEDYVYVNDPLTKEKNKAVNREDFEEAWIQMGQQAFTISPL
ncbi:C39 family peptidase [Gracilibacillus xinjiangensis]|uniref:C39 family peptidase n=1 Tax=Gracilibacillus xinjiangensis TaxID=1193282 RepID=A0ABV8WQ25_9BACI